MTRTLSGQETGRSASWRVGSWPLELEARSHGEFRDQGGGGSRGLKLAAPKRQRGKRLDELEIERAAGGVLMEDFQANVMRKDAAIGTFARQRVIHVSHGEK